jgi:hypothetical protein
LSLAYAGPGPLPRNISNLHEVLHQVAIPASRRNGTQALPSGALGRLTDDPQLVEQAPQDLPFAGGQRCVSSIKAVTSSDFDA